MTESPAMSDEECLAEWCTGEDWCPITCTMDVISNKWHPVIIHRLLNQGALRFNDLADEVGPITNKVLSSSLDDLQENDLVNREIVNDQPVEVEYALTERGQSLQPVIDALEDWGQTNLRPADTPDGGGC